MTVRTLEGRLAWLEVLPDSHHPAHPRGTREGRGRRWREGGRERRKGEGEGEKGLVHDYIWRDSRTILNEAIREVIRLCCHGNRACSYYMTHYITMGNRQQSRWRVKEEEEGRQGGGEEGRKMRKMRRGGR